MPDNAPAGGCLILHNSQPLLAWGGQDSNLHIDLGMTSRPAAVRNRYATSLYCALRWQV